MGRVRLSAPGRPDPDGDIRVSRGDPVLDRGGPRIIGIQRRTIAYTLYREAGTTITTLAENSSGRSYIGQQRGRRRDLHLPGGGRSGRRRGDAQCTCFGNGARHYPSGSE